MSPFAAVEDVGAVVAASERQRLDHLAPALEGGRGSMRGDIFVGEEEGGSVLEHRLGVRHGARRCAGGDLRNQPGRRLE
jgi:hypothetical protein